jgi:hypothetical protein
MADLVSVRSAESNPGKSLLLAILLTIVGAALIFILSRVLFINEDFFGSIYQSGLPRALVGFFLITFPYTHQRLEGKRRARFSHLPDGAVPFDAYVLPWYIVLTYGILIAFAMAGVSLFLVWLVGMATGFFISRAISILSIVLLFVTFYYLGFWSGSRSARSPYLNAAGMVLGYTILEMFVAIALNIDIPLRSPFGFAAFLILSLVAVLIGVRTGKRRRLSHYVDFLLNLLAHEDRQAVINNIYGEVNERMRERH